MPKGKKSKKVVSLVAYESAAETDSEMSVDEGLSEEESVEEVDEQEETAEYSDRSGSIKSKSEQKRSTRDSELSNEEIQDSPSSVLDLFKASKKPVDEIVINDEESISLQETLKLQEASNIEPSTSAQTVSSPQKKETTNEPSKSIYTIEKGFLPGCNLIKLPPAPKAPCSQELQNKIIQVVERMNKVNYSINENIYKKKNFKNPSIYEKLIEAYGIDEFGSSFPTHVEDLKSHGYMFYDELNQAQCAEWAKREKEKKDRTKIAMTPAKFN